jgi:hypothetical protein
MFLRVQLVDMVETAQLTGSMHFSLTDAQRKRLQQLQARIRMLEVCLQHLDQDIALFNQYN